MIELNNDISLLVNDVIGASFAVMGMPGSGKSNTAAVLAEEMLSANLPLTIIDIDGEHYGLAEKYPLLICGASSVSQVPLNSNFAEKLAEFVLKSRISVILDLSEYTDEVASEIVLAYTASLWKHSATLRTPHPIFLEECHEWIPENGKSPVKSKLLQIAKRGRKRGLSLVMISQRPASVSKNALEAAPFRILHRVVGANDIAAYQRIIPESKKWVEDTSRSLSDGEAVFASPYTSARTQIRLRETFHGGYTPTLDDSGEVPDLKQVDSGTLDKLQAMFEPEAAKLPPTDDRDRLVQRIQELEAELIKRSDPLPPIRSNLATKRLEKRQKRAFDNMLRSIDELRSLDRNVLIYLLDCPDPVSNRTLAIRLGYSESSLRANPPVALVKMGLVKRQGTGYKNFRYESCVFEFLAETYPDLDEMMLFEQLHTRLNDSGS